MSETRSILLRLVIDELSKFYPELLPANISKPDYIRYATASDELKRDLLTSTYEKYGPKAILKIGLGMRHTGGSPVNNLFLNASEPLSILQKWIELENRLNLRFRIQYKEIDNLQALEICHFALHGDPSSSVEDLLICGIQIALFERIGCQNTRCSLVAEDGSEVPIYDTGQLVDGWNSSEACHFFRWKIEWSSIDNKSTPNDTTPPGSNLFADYHDPMDIIGPVLSILAQDISKNWKIGEIASRLQMSKRTLQRYLNFSEASFSLLTGAARINTASRLLLNNDVSITEISHQCGFSDSAHFSRLFSQSTGLPPSQYRHLLTTSTLR